MQMAQFLLCLNRERTEMKISAKLLIALLIVFMAFAAVGCKGKAPEPPKAMSEVIEISEGVKISIDSFHIASPDFIDQEKKARRPSVKEEAEVSVLRLRIKNDSDSEITYTPLHFAPKESRIQICTEPNPETGDRTNIRAVAFDGKERVHTPSQRVEPNVKIPAGGEVTDEYLFDVPATPESEKLIVLIPESILSIGTPGKTIRFYLDQPSKVKPQPPASLNQAMTIDGIEVKITEVGAEYAELEQREAPKEPLKYAYAYTEKPVLALKMSIKNKGKNAVGYDPSHTNEIPGINLNLATHPLKRIKLPVGIIGKGQVKGAITIDKGDEISDVYFFERPESDGKLDFTLSGHIFGVNGIYRFSLNYKQTEPPKPDLEPYKTAEGGDDSAADAENAEEGAEDAGAEEKKD